MTYRLDHPARSLHGDLRPVGMATFLRAIPGLAERFSDVPDRYVKRAVEEGTGLALVSITCRCGSLTLRVGESLECGCGRTFVFLDPHVMAAEGTSG